MGSIVVAARAMELGQSWRGKHTLATETNRLISHTIVHLRHRVIIVLPLSMILQVFVIIDSLNLDYVNRLVGAVDNLGGGVRHDFLRTHSIERDE